MAQFPSSSSAYGIWSLKEQRDAVRGDNWPLYTPPSDPNFADVSLLLHGDGTSGAQNNTFLDSSTNDFTITRNGNTTQGSFSPYSVSGPYNPATHGGSGYFDGSGDYLSILDNTAFDLEGSDFTIECWVYLNTYGSNSFSAPVSKWVTGIQSWTTYISSSSIIFSYSPDGSAASYVNYTASVSNPLSTWSHYAFTRSGDTLYIFKDGVLINTFSVTGLVIPNRTSALQIGATNNGGYGNLNGYINDLRLVKGTALYTSAFTPPTAPLTAVSNTSLLCNFTNAGIFDSTGKNVLETVGNAQIDTAVTKFGTGSMEFDGSGDYLFSSANTAFDFGLSAVDFTIEAWIYPQQNRTVHTIAAVWPQGLGEDQWIFCIRDGVVGLVWSPDNTNDVFISGGSVALNQWHHVAVTRNGNTFRTFLNGTQTASGTNSSTSGSSNPLTIGYFGSGSGTSSTSYWDGYIDDLRITKGVARYTTNFTPPTDPFPDQ